jgi:hypothetical protein
MKPIIIKNAIPLEIIKFLLVELSITQNCLGIVIPEKYSDVGTLGNYYALVSSENLLKFLTPTISKKLGLDLRPTFSWTEYASTGAIIKPYVGRSSCEFTVICCLESNSWPFYINQEEYTLDVGDICIYAGSTSEYYRKEFTGNRNLQVMLNYVDVNGKYGYLEFDTRKTLGASIALTAPIVQAEQAALPFKIL